MKPSPTPLISICMPTLNSERYLQQRLESIGDQRGTDWELVVVDSASDDQTLPMIEAFSRAHPGRVTVHQAPRDGIYTNINRAIRLARGRYVYIATSDDTMAGDCLEKMAAALEAHPDCALAHCPLRRLEADGRPESPDWWTQHSLFARSSGPMLHQTHRRRAPLDGLLHLIGGSVYVSLTQLLIRRDLFERIGCFESRWGSIGDLNWDMRAALATDTLHVADTWASWRLHPDQATAATGIGEDQHTGRIESMIEHALADRRDDLPEAVRQALDAGHAKRWAHTRHWVRRRQACGARHRQIGWMIGQLLRGSWPARRQLLARLTGAEPLPHALPDLLRRWLERLMGQPMLIALDEQPATPIKPDAPGHTPSTSAKAVA